MWILNLRCHKRGAEGTLPLALRYSAERKIHDEERNVDGEEEGVEGKIREWFRVYWYIVT